MYIHMHLYMRIHMNIYVYIYIDMSIYGGGAPQGQGRPQRPGAILYEKRIKLRPF